MIIYYPKTHYNKLYRAELFPLLKPYIKGEGFTDAQRIAIYGVSEDDFSIVDDMHQAQVCILPMSWNYYVKTKQIKIAEAYIKQAKAANKPVWSFISGDYGVKHPDFSHLTVFRLTGLRSKHGANHHGMPVFFEDYLAKHYLLKTYLPTTYSKKPLVGFCGQANASVLRACLDVIKKSWFNLKSLAGLSFYEPDALLATTYLRAKLLQRLRRSEGIADQFILRKQYRAGVHQGKSTHKTTLEFYNNILESHYVLCVRGGGNFSVRFYETLMMGRIPIYVNTDGFLPLIDKIDWKRHIVWIEPDEQHNIVEKVVSFHFQLTHESLKALCESNRKLWEDKLTMKGFFNEMFNDQ